MKEENKLIEKNFNGLLIVKSRNGNFNAGFDGNPRTLPDGTIFATDKALKYCIREYLSTFKNKPVFVRRERYFENNKDYVYKTLRENFEEKCNKKLDELSDKDILDKLISFIDIRLFGVVFSVSKNKKQNDNNGDNSKDDNSYNISLTGPVQISYGVNRYPQSGIYVSQILSPYADKKNKATTIGEETRTDEVYYVYNISVNSANAKKTKLTYSDLELLKEALLNSVDCITSCTKYGCESIALIWLNNKDDLILNNLDEFIEIEKSEDGKIKLDLKKLEEFLKGYGFDKVEKAEFSLKNFDYSEKSSDENKIQVIFKKGKVEVEE